MNKQVGIEVEVDKDESKSLRNYLHAALRYFPSVESIIYGTLTIIIIGNIFFHYWLKSVILNIFPNIFYFLLPWVTFWIVLNLIYLFRLPRKKKKTVGILLSIITENDTQKRKIKKDFLEELELVRTVNGLKPLISFVNVQNLLTKKINNVLNELIAKLNSPETIKENYIFNKVNKKMRCQFFIWGDLVERNAGQYFLRLNALVIHSSPPTKGKIKLNEGFEKLWPSEVSFPINKEYQGFRKSANEVFIAIEYIVGLAALISRDSKTAIKLLENFQKDTIKYPSLKILNASAQDFLTEAHYRQALYTYKNKPDEARDLIKKALQFNPLNEGLWLAKSIIDFVVDQNFTSAFHSVEKAQQYSQNNGTWRYNKAFLLMASEKFEDAAKLYHIIGEKEYPIEPLTVSEVIDFTENYLRENPNKIQFWYTLGIIHFKKRGNCVESLVCFDKFLYGATDEKYKPLITRANSYVSECIKEMEKNANSTDIEKPEDIR